MNKLIAVSLVGLLAFFAFQYFADGGSGRTSPRHDGGGENGGGNEPAARASLDTALADWMSGRESDAAPKKMVNTSNYSSAVIGVRSPVLLNYEIKSFRAQPLGGMFEATVAVNYKSEAGTAIPGVLTYSLYPDSAVAGGYRISVREVN